MDNLHSRADLLKRGYSEAEIRAKLNDRTWQKLAPGSYLIGPEPSRPEARAALRAKAMLMRFDNDRTVASHRSAAALLGLPLHGHPKTVELTKAGPNGSKITQLAQIRALRLDAADRATVDGFGVTSVARTLVDLARHDTVGQAVIAADHALHHEMVTGPEIVAACNRLSSASRGPRARRILARADGRSESVQETIQRLILIDGGIEGLELQVEICDAEGSFIARVDQALIEHGIALEYDGEQKYRTFLKPGEDPATAVIKEKRREDAIRTLGWTMLRFDRHDLRHPDRVVAAVRRAIRDRRRVPPVVGSVRVAPALTVEF